MINKGVFITGTDTGVGKSVVCAILAYYLKRQGFNVGVMKPFQTGACLRGNKLFSQDLVLISGLSGVKADERVSVPFKSRLPVSPYAAFSGRKRGEMREKVLACFDKLICRHDLVLVEGSGGLLVPIDEGYFMADLAADLAIPLVVVARPSLGTINHTLLTVNEAFLRGLEVRGVVINHAERRAEDISVKNNPGIIEKFGPVDILGEVPYLRSVKEAETGRVRMSLPRKPYIDIAALLKRGSALEDGTDRLRAWDKKYVWHPFTQMKDWIKSDPLVISGGKGSYLKDSDGRWYIDGVSSLWVNVHGHRKQEIDAAIKRQLGKVAHSTFLGLSNEPAVKLAERLVRIAPKGLKKVFFSDNGSTAVEAALKISFQYWQQQGSLRLRAKRKFISFVNAYHGDTIGSVSVGGIDLFHEIYRPFLFNTIKVNAPYCYRCHLGLSSPSCRMKCSGELEEVLRRRGEEICAVLIEPVIQGAAGMIKQPKGYLRLLRSLCDKYNVHMICDEVAVGFGRTGKMFACENEGVSPDILCLAKGISAGYLPLAATLTTQRIFNAFLGEYRQKKTFFHGHSYTANPLASAAALASLDVFKKERVLDGLSAKIKFMSSKLKKFRVLKAVGDVRQAGFIAGIELVRNKLTKDPYPWQEKIGIRVIERARENGVILRPLGNVIVLFPPLSISMDELKRLLDVTYKAIKDVTG